MIRLVKIVDNKYVQIEEYKNPNICFNTNEYDDFENYCTLRETFDPFEMFYENKKIKKQLEEKNKKYIPGKYAAETFIKTINENILLKNQQKEFILYLRHLSNWYSADGIKQGMVNEILQKYKEIIGGK